MKYSKTFDSKRAMTRERKKAVLTTENKDTVVEKGMGPPIVVLPVAKPTPLPPAPLPGGPPIYVPPPKGKKVHSNSSESPEKGQT